MHASCAEVILRAVQAANSWENQAKCPYHCRQHSARTGNNGFTAFAWKFSTEAGQGSQRFGSLNISSTCVHIQPSALQFVVYYTIYALEMCHTRPSCRETPKLEVCLLCNGSTAQVYSRADKAAPYLDPVRQ